MVRAEKHDTHSEVATSASASTVGYKTQVDRPGLLKPSCGMCKAAENFSSTKKSPVMADHGAHTSSSLQDAPMVS
jgi:hypothetical protein